MPTITSMFGLLEKLESSDIAVHQNRCVSVRNRNATCTKCVDVCTSGALAMAENELIVTAENCIGCGTCATMCPTCALEAKHPNDAELLRLCDVAMKANKGEVAIACEQLLKAAKGLYDTEKVVGVACLGRVEESLLSSLAGAGAVRVSLVKAKCTECAYSVGLQTTEAVCNTANTLFETWNHPLRVDIGEKLPREVRLQEEAAFDKDRRGFFSGLKSEAQSVAATTADYALKDTLGIEEAPEPKYMKVMEDGTLPHCIPDRRERLLNNLAELGDPQDIMIATRLWAHVIIDADLCSSCQMCATFCPTGAIAKFMDEDGTFGVAHYPGDCVKCHCCVDICAEGALSLSDEVFAVDLLSGAVERYEMKPIKNPPNNPHAIWHSMKDLLGIEQVYER